MHSEQMNSQSKYPPLKSLWHRFLHLVVLGIGWVIYFYLLFDVIINNRPYLMKCCFYLTMAFLCILASSIIRLFIINNKPNRAKLSIVDKPINDYMDRDNFSDGSKAKEASKIIIKVDDAGKKIFFYS